MELLSAETTCSDSKISPSGVVQKSLWAELNDKRNSINLYNLFSNSKGESRKISPKTEVGEEVLLSAASQPVNNPPKDALKFLMGSREPAKKVGGSRISFKRNRDSPPSISNQSKSKNPCKLNGDGAYY